MDNDDIDKLVAKWSSKVDTGIYYGDIIETYSMGEITAYKAKSMLMKYGGYTKEEADNAILVADFRKKYPKIDWSAGTIRRYKEYIEPTGISAQVFDKYRTERAKCKGVDADGDGEADRYSKQREVVALIDSLPITNEQKDALFLGDDSEWAKSSLLKTPWHRR